MGKTEPALNKTMIFKNVWETLKVTWPEWHMIISGWGDGAALNKGQRIPSIQQTADDYKETDFYAILAREAWYYKVGLASGRLTWALIIVILLVRLLG